MPARPARARVVAKEAATHVVVDTDHCQASASKLACSLCADQSARTCDNSNTHIHLTLGKTWIQADLYERQISSMSFSSEQVLRHANRRHKRKSASDVFGIAPQLIQSKIFCSRSVRAAAGARPTAAPIEKTNFLAEKIFRSSRTEAPLIRQLNHSTKTPLVLDRHPIGTS